MRLLQFSIILIFLSIFAFQVSGQNLYPNELKEYEFFGKEKLKTLKIGISTSKEVKKLFNSDCQYECNYNQNWTIRFKYFDERTFPPLNSNAKLKPNLKYKGKLFKIILAPKYVIPFENVVLPSALKHIGGVGAVGENIEISSERYRDDYGLEYQIQYETRITNNGKENLKTKEVRLESIEYGATNALLNKMFIKAP